MSYLCCECLKSFSASSSLFQHLKIMHPFLQRYECKQSKCHRSFPNISSLKKHFAISHNHNRFNTHSVRQNVFTESELNNNNSSDNNSTMSNNDSEPEDTEHSDSSINKALLIFISKFYNNPSFPRKLVQLVLKKTKNLLNEKQTKYHLLIYLMN